MADTDRFVEFVDRLARDLDRAPATGAGLAAEAYVSRYHFDRVITAVAGESPTRFRNRVLLERAGYRMLSTPATLLDIATEAGFSSHEAFTRAFRRAYGSAPSHWRRHPTRFQIPAPNDVHFHPPAGLRLPARHKMRGVDLVVEMVEHHVWLVGQLVERAAGLDDVHLDEPFQGPIDGLDGESLRWALSRLIGQLAMWSAAMDDAEYDFSVEQAEPVASMRGRIAEVGPRFLDQVRRVAEEGRFDETFVDAFSERPVVMTYGAMLAHVLTFAAHHRLLAMSRLREYGVTDLGFGDPKLWLNPTSD